MYSTYVSYVGYIFTRRVSVRGAFARRASAFGFYVQRAACWLAGWLAASAAPSAVSTKPQTQTTGPTSATHVDSQQQHPNHTTTPRPTPSQRREMRAILHTGHLHLPPRRVEPSRVQMWPPRSPFGVRHSDALYALLRGESRELVDNRKIKK